MPISADVACRPARRSQDFTCKDSHLMQTVLIQLDTDPHPSSFDQVVAVDSGIDRILSYGRVTEDTVEPLVHGAIFTRGPADLHHTAIFIGGSHVESGERLLRRVQETFFGPMRVSVMMDSSGCNTTAAAAVAAAARHVSLPGTTAVVPGGTGPVGQRIAQLLAAEGAQVTLVSRSAARAADACDRIRTAVASCVSPGRLIPAAATTPDETAAIAQNANLLFAAGAAGVRFLDSRHLAELTNLQVAVDLNAVPPAGLAGIEPADRAVRRHGIVCYGALGVGHTKMKVHRQALQRLFTASDLIFDTAAIYRLALELEADGPV